MSRFRLHLCLSAALASLFLTAAAGPRSLVSDLRRGGYVLVFRHAHAPLERPARPEPDNARGERQIDAEGRAEAQAIRRGLEAAQVRASKVYSSPAYRAVQTSRAMGLPEGELRPELGDGGASMAPTAAGPAGAAWLKARVAEPPPAGKDVVIVTHLPNIAQAFGAGLDLADGEAAVFRPDGRGGAELVGRVAPGDWPPGR